MQSRIEAPSLRSLSTIAFPMIASQASETIMLFVDRIFLSWLGKLHIAASMSGGLSSFVFSSLFAGIVGYTNAIVAQYYGAGRHRRCVETTAQGIYTSIVFTPVLFLLIPVVHRLFSIVGHSPEQIDLEFRYFRILMSGAFLVLLRQTLVGFFLGIGRTRIVMVANLIGMIVNVPINYILIFGKMGFPVLGIEGAAIGTILGSSTIFVVLLIAYIRHEYFRETPVREAFKLRWDLTARLLRYGMPAGIELFLNVFAFNIFVQLMHSLGEDVAAAVTITFNYDMVAFIPMIGLGVAVTSLVGRHMGAEDPDGAHRAAMLALKVGYSYAAFMMVVFVFGAPLLVSVFAAGLEASDRSLLDLSTLMLRLAALYTLADITQLVFAGALRGAGDTRWTMIISVTLHWLMAIGMVFAIRVFQLPPLRIWTFFIGFVVTLGIVIVLRYRGGKWRSIRVIEEIPPDLEPEIITESRWM